ncbi:MAG: RNA polymerase sigma factor [Sedimentisphaerales bacterium]|nr:RNA polymerase sigma factor [Sedimentisphaerales bacterium]
MFVDKNVLDELIHIYYERVFTFVRYHIYCLQDAEDITQNAFLRAYRHNIDESPYNFLCTIAINLIKDSYKKSKTCKYLSCDLELLPNNLVDLKDISKKDDLKVFLREKIEMLLLEQKAVIILRYFVRPPMTYEDIGKILGRSVPTLRNIHENAIMKLRKEIERYLEL